MSEPYQQGQADGLCGLYSVLNFLRTQADWKKETPAEAMEYVMEAAEAEGAFSPSWITGGYRSTEIKSILNCVFDRWWMPYRAVYLCEISKKEKEDNFGLYIRILGRKGSVIGKYDEHSHWLLFTNVNGQNLIIDSDIAQHSKRSFGKRSKSKLSDDSIVVLPQARPLVQIEA